MVRQSAWLQTVTYGAVGGTKAQDLMSYPPAGFRPFQQRSRIGHGVLRWEHAWQSTLSWGIQRNSGMVVRLQDSPSQVTEGTYTPVTFDSAGTPVAPEVTEDDEVVYGAQGQPFITPGDTATLVLPIGPVRFRAPCRVI